MLGFIALLLAVTVAATVWTVWKYRRDAVLLAILMFVTRIYNRQKR